MAFRSKEMREREKTTKNTYQLVGLFIGVRLYARAEPMVFYTCWMYIHIGAIVASAVACSLFQYFRIYKQKYNPPAFSYIRRWRIPFLCYRGAVWYSKMGLAMAARM